MQREDSQAQLLLDQQRREGELSMATAREIADERDGVYDPQDGELVDSGLTAEQEEQLYAESQLAEGDEIIEPEVASRVRLGEHRVRSDGPAIGPTGVPIIPESEVPDDSIIDLSDDEPSSEPLPEVSPARKITKVQRAAQVAIVRVNTDLDMTYGQYEPNLWRLKKGRRYRLPINVANHLHEKGLVATWG